MGIPYAKTYHVTARGVVLRNVACEHCRTEFVYALARETAGQGTSVLFLDNQGAQEQAASNAEAELSKQLEIDVDPVPCPSCHLYQTDMIRKLRKDAYWWMSGLAIVSVLVAIIVGAILLSALVNDLRNFSTGVRVVMALITVAGAAGCFGLLQRRKSLSKSYNPNREEFADRRRSCKQAVMLKEEFDKVGSDPLLAPAQQAQAKSAWSDQRFNFYLRFAMCLVFTITCLVMLVSDSTKIANCMASEKWPQASANIVSTFVKTESAKQKDRDVLYYSPAISYQYEVAGRKFNGDTVQFDPPRSQNQHEIYALINSIPVGTEIQVHYNPANPETSVIIPGFSEGQMFHYGILACIILGGTAFLAVDIWRYWKLRGRFRSEDGS